MLNKTARGTETKCHVKIKNQNIGNQEATHKVQMTMSSNTKEGNPKDIGMLMTYSDKNMRKQRNVTGQADHTDMYKTTDPHKMTRKDTE